MADLPRSHVRLADLASRKPTPFSLIPTDAERAAIAAELDLTQLKKLRFDGEITPVGHTDWALTAALGATVVQDCVVTLAPVTTRIDEKISRHYLADLPTSDASEVEMLVDETHEQLPTDLDFARVMIEALSLALPAFPRAADANLGAAVFTETGKAPMTDDDAKPFAGLAALKNKLSNPD